MEETARTSSVIINEDTSEDESTDSVFSIYSSLPPSIADWKFVHIMKWILELYESEKYSYEDLDLNYFKKLDGSFLMNLTETEWEQIDKKHSKPLFENVQRLKKLSNTNCRSNEVSNSEREYLGEGEEIVRNPERRISGLTRKQRVWEFLRDLLMDPQYCPSLIRWEDYETKKFRLVDGSKVARLWGKSKNNHNMSYEKFSRAIRHYYKDNVILSVPKEKNVYKFGVNAKGIETDVLNFENAVNF